jgi:hypothetical protein
MKSMKKKSIVVTAVLCAFLLVVGVSVGQCDAIGKAASIKSAEDLISLTDYSQASNWLMMDTSGSLPVDVFYLYPTAWQKGPDDGNYCAVDNVSMIKGAIGAFNRQATAFLPVGNIYAPYYRQADAMYTLSMPTIEQQEESIRIIPAADGVAAFNYYLENYNRGRPFILAGHSQGSNVLLYILSSIKNQPEVLDRMVAAYVIGFSVTSDYLAQNPPLKFATGPDDTGVIISYNTEAEGVTSSPVVRPGAIAINPISWTLTEEEAPKEENAGSIRLISAISCDLTPVKGLASAQVDTTRGVVVCKSVDVSRYSMQGLPVGVYHTYDYPFYYYNIRANAQNRVEKYLASHPSLK